MKPERLTIETTFLFGSVLLANYPQNSRERTPFSSVFVMVRSIAGFGSALPGCIAHPKDIPAQGAVVEQERKRQKKRGVKGGRKGWNCERWEGNVTT